MKLTNGNDTVELHNEIQIRAYLLSGYTETEDKSKRKRGGAYSGDGKS